jgi:hypothetical protein
MCVALATLLVAVLCGCDGDEEGGGPPTILQARVTLAEDIDAPAGRTALLIKVWVDDPNEDIGRV